MWETIQTYLQNQLPGWMHTCWMILLALAVFLVGRIIIRAVDRRIDRHPLKTPLDPGLIRFLRSILRASLYILLAYVVAELVGVPTASLVALIGSAGLAVGLALQGSLANFAGGVLIIVTKPFRVGDFIAVGEHQGAVSSIGLFYTRLVDGDEKLIVLPNGKLADSTVKNLYPNGERRIGEQVGIAYSADVALARRLILGVFDAHKKLIRRDEAIVFVARMDESAVVLEYHCWVKREDYYPELWSLTEDIKAAFDQGGIEIPFNQLDIHVKTDEK